MAQDTADCSFLELPAEFIVSIVSFLTVRDTLALQQTCRQLAALTRSNTVWLGHLWDNFGLRLKVLRILYDTGQ